MNIYIYVYIYIYVCVSSNVQTCNGVVNRALLK